MRSPRQESIMFFADNAGYCTPPGKMVCAKLLANAEVIAERIGLEVLWEYETDIDDSWCDQKQQRQLANGSLEVWWARIEDHHGNILASLGNIFLYIDETDYKRVIEAELYSEAFEELKKGSET